MPYADPKVREAFKHSWYLKKKDEPEFKKRRAINSKKWRDNNKEKVKETRKQYLKKHPEKIRLWQNKGNRNRRLRIVELLGGKCNKCGIVDIRVLQVDHINGDGAEERRKYKSSGLKAHILSELRKNNAEAKKKYQLLCANCNWIKIWEEREYN